MHDPIKSRFRRVGPAGSMIAMVLLSSGCDWAAGLLKGRPTGVEIARVDGKILTSVAFQDYLLDVFGSEEEILGGDELMSRLLDQYMEEQIFLAKAVSLGIQAGEEEVRQHVELMTPGNEEAGEDRDRFQSRYRDTRSAAASPAGQASSTRSPATRSPRAARWVGAT